MSTLDDSARRSLVASLVTEPSTWSHVWTLIEFHACRSCLRPFTPHDPRCEQCGAHCSGCCLCPKVRT